MKLTVKEIIEACNGTLLCGKEETEISNVCIDSRKIEKGSLFVPIKGERTDAHKYIDSTFAAGAIATLTQEHLHMEDSHAWIRVNNTQEALQKIASAYRAKFTLPIIGVTGSVGKTTTKEMIATALSSSKNVMKTKGNLNSQIGLPLTMFQLLPEHEVAVIEMGMSDFGEMARLSKIASPNYAVITNIGISHIEQLHTKENIRTEKLHITDSFNHNSVLFLNGDDELLANLEGKLPYRCVFFGTNDNCDYRAKEIQMKENFTRFLLVSQQETQEVELPVLGLHNVYNALAAIAVADTLNIKRTDSIAALKKYCPPVMRQQIRKNKNEIIIIDDTYNASPDSMKSSLEVLKGLQNKGKKVAVLADMLELGSFSHKAHFEVGEYAATLGIDILVTIGKEAVQIMQGAVSHNKNMVCFCFQENSEAEKKLGEILKSGDAVLIKGSRGMRTDEIVDYLINK